MKKITLIILILSINTLFSQGKIAAVKAVIKASTNKTTRVVVKITAKETGVIFTNKILKNKLALQASKFSDADFILYFRNIGYSRGNATKLIKELGKEKAIKLYSFIYPSISKGKKLLFIEDFKRSPGIMETIFTNKSLKTAYSKCIGMSESFRLDIDFLKQVYLGVSPIKLTQKQNLYSKVGLSNNIMFVEKVVTLSNSLKVKGIFPQFQYVYKKYLPVEQYLRNDAANYNYAFRHFQNNLKNNPQLQKHFSKEQVDEMLNRTCKSVKKSKGCGMVRGYIWHHSEDGTMQLVKDSDHNIKHLGLRAFEGGGKYLRESTLYISAKKVLPKMEYRRDIYHKGFVKVKKQISEETGNFHTDTYTGKSLKPGEKWDFEHIISAKEFSSLPNVELLNVEVLSSILNHKNNIGFTMRNINQSKGKYELIEWLERKSNGRNITNAEYYKIDINKAKKIRKETLSFLKKEIAKALK